MKIRLGFVSNSSSSSFTIIAPENYDYRGKIEDPALVELYERAFPADEKLFNGQKVKIYYGNDTDGENNVLWNGDIDKYIYEKKCIEELDEDFDEKYSLAAKLYEEFEDYFDNTCLKLYGE